MQILSRILIVAVFALLSACQSGPYRPQSATVSKSLDFKWPLQGTFRMTDRFGSRRGKHKGLDLAAPRNTPVYATAAGKVKYIGSSYRGYGKLIIMNHGKNRWSSYYAHLNKYKVQRGQWVKKGDLIGLVGRTGRATGDHLHFELRWKNSPVDPYPLFTQPVDVRRLSRR